MHHLLTLGATAKVLKYLIRELDRVRQGGVAVEVVLGRRLMGIMESGEPSITSISRTVGRRLFAGFVVPRSTLPSDRFCALIGTETNAKLFAKNGCPELVRIATSPTLARRLPKNGGTLLAKSTRWTFGFRNSTTFNALYGIAGLN